MLYKASIAHNLPVMCQAMSLGADKNWTNSDNLDRTPLHQAVIVVSLTSNLTAFNLNFNGFQKFKFKFFLEIKFEF